MKQKSYAVSNVIEMLSLVEIHFVAMFTRLAMAEMFRPFDASVWNISLTNQYFGFL